MLIISKGKHSSDLFFVTPLTFFSVLMEKGFTNPVQEIMHYFQHIFQEKDSSIQRLKTTKPSKCVRARVCFWALTWRLTRSHISSPGASWATSWRTPATTSSPPTGTNTGETRRTLAWKQCCGFVTWMKIYISAVSWHSTPGLQVCWSAPRHSSVQNAAVFLKVLTGLWWNRNSQNRNGYHGKKNHAMPADGEIRQSHSRCSLENRCM